MKNEQRVTIKRDCEAVMIPSGEKIRLAAGTAAWVTQTLGGGVTLMTERGYMVRLDGKDADAVGLPPLAERRSESLAGPDSITAVEKRVWEQLRSCFDPEIPVNIVDLGLIYRCAVSRAEPGYRVEVRFTLTAEGCGMGQWLKRDIENKLAMVPGVREVEVELVWDPPWNQSMISESAKHELGIL